MEAVVHILPIACATWLSVLFLKRAWSKNNAYPPGPPGLPLVGNLFDMPKSLDWLKYGELGKTYGNGDVVFMNVPGNSTLVINTYEAAIELLDRRSNIYSSRPSMTMVRDLEGWSFMVTWRAYDEKLKAGRQTLLKFLQPRKVHAYETIQLQATNKLLHNILQNPEDFLKHIRHAAGAIIMMFSYGHKAADENDSFVELAEQGLGELSDFGSFFLVDMFPALQYIPEWFPGAGFKRRAREVRKISAAMQKEPYIETKAALLNGTASPSMLSNLIEMNRDEEGRISDEERISGYAATIYVAGADTTVSVVSTFVLAMVMYPDVQQRAHAELERVIGTDTLPRFEDRGRLPYVTAIIEECLRWQIITPLSLPHCTTENDVYNGYFIPAGTTIHTNLWWMLRNPEQYPSPEAFIPERWLPENGRAIPTLASKIAFGFGRRRCVGKAFAESSVYIAVASLLAAFKFERAKGDDGEIIVPSGAYSENFLRYPEPFRCRISPRSTRLAQLVRELQTASD